MSKKEEEEAVNYSDFTYTGEETITMNAKEFFTLRKGLEKALQNGVEGKYPQVLKYFNLKSGEPVDNPTEKDIQSGVVQQFADNEATFSQENLHVSYNTEVYPEIYNALQQAMIVHQDMVDKGVAKPLAEVQKFFEERNAQGQSKVQSEEPTMNVVKD